MKQRFQGHATLGRNRLGLAEERVGAGGLANRVGPKKNPLIKIRR